MWRPGAGTFHGFASFSFFACRRVGVMSMDLLFVVSVE